MPGNDSFSRGSQMSLNVKADGYIITEDGPVRGHAIHENGKTVFSEGPLGDVPDVRGVIVPKLIDTHTHCADAGVKVVPGMSLEELVAPPDGLKHRYLRSASRERLIEDMGNFEKNAENNGIFTFIDFREGGVEGGRMAREACKNAVVLGRPVSAEFDANEVADILSIADGIALSSISDISPRYAEKVADATHKAGKIFAIHCSERVREDFDEILSLNPAFVVHMCEATDSDLKKCADSDIPISVCARSNRFFGKVPPLARMKDIGCTVAMGTDNAMLCTPDLRPEACLFSELLGKDSDNWVWNSLIAGGQKLLYHACGIGSPEHMDKGFAVLPMSGDDPRSSWYSDGRVFSI